MAIMLNSRSNVYEHIFFSASQPPDSSTLSQIAGIADNSTAIPASAVGGSVRRAGAGGVTEDLVAKQPLPSHEVVRGVDLGHVVP